MAEENKNSKEPTSEKQTPPNNENSIAPAAQQQQQQQPTEQAEQQQSVVTDEPCSQTQSSQSVDAGGTVEGPPVGAPIDISALLGSITVPEITTRVGISPEDLGQSSHINGDFSEEEQMRLASKTAAFPDIPALTSQHATAISCTAGEMEVAQLKVKIICQEKNIMALRMELKAAELQVDAKNRIDEKKTRLVELLDNKLKTVEGRNVKLLDMVEQMLKDKDGNTNRLKEATQNMQDLSQRLINSERMKTELTQANAELRKMLESLETKGSQIAKLAIEKVMKYKDANDQMQLELTGLKDEANAKINSSDQLGNIEAAAAALKASNTEVTSSACNELWCKIVELQQRIATALQKSNDQSVTVEALQQTIQEASEANTALGVSVEAARQKTGEGLSALSVENDQLRALVEDFDTARREMEAKEAKCQDILNEQKNYVTAKDKETEDLKEELQRLKGAIGQLIGSK